MWTIACERFGACLSTASRAAAIGRHWRWPKDFAPVRRNRPILPMGQSADRLVGVALLALGDLKGARRHIERMLSGYVARGSHIIRFQYDQRVVARSYHSHVLWLQGFADQAMRSVDARSSTLAPAITRCRCPMPCCRQPAPWRFSSAI